MCVWWIRDIWEIGEGGWRRQVAEPGGCGGWASAGLEKVRCHLPARGWAPLSPPYFSGSWKCSALLVWIYSPALASTKKQWRCPCGYSQGWMSGDLGSVLRSATYLLCTNLVNPLSCTSRFVSGKIFTAASFGLPHLVITSGEETIAACL